MADLRTDYKDDVLNINTNERRKYRMIPNADGTVSFEDVTDYVQNGDSFGSSDLNAITEWVNRSLTGADVVDNLESTETKLPLSANMGREINEKITNMPKTAYGQSYIGGGNTSSEVIDLSTVLPENSTILCIQISQLYTPTSGVHALAYEANETDRTLIVHSKEANASGRIHFFYAIYYTE